LAWLGASNAPARQNSKPTTVTAGGNWGRLAAALLLLLLPAPVRAADNPADAVQKAAGQWIDVRAETVRIASEWESQRQLLASLADSLAQRAGQLEARRDLLSAQTARQRKDLADLQAENQSASAALESGAAHLRDLDGSLARLRPSLPPRLSAGLALAYRSLADPTLALGERMQLTMTVLERCLEFDRVVTCDNEAVQAEGEAGPRMLEVIYWGLSHGYALDPGAGRAWYGSPGPSGWTWEPLPGSASAVARLVAIYRGAAEPGFVEVAARIEHTETPPGTSASP
jgi:Protein of unknown function (DUF3450)